MQPTPEGTRPPEATATPKPPSAGRQVARLLQEKWAEYVVEMFVIVFSISASFALDEWKDARGKRELEQTYLRGLQNDLEADSVHLTEVITETNLVVGRARNLLAANRPETAPESVLNDLLVIFKRPRFIAEDATFSDLKSSGNLQALQDFPLKNALFDYYRLYESTGLVESAERDVTTSLIAPYMVKRLPLAPGNRAMTGAPKPGAVLALLNDMEFRNNVFIRQANREELLGDYRQILALNGQIRARMKREIR